MIRRATIEDMPNCLTLIQRVIREVTQKDYNPIFINDWVNSFTLEKIEQSLDGMAYFISQEGDEILGMGAILIKDKPKGSELYPKIEEKGHIQKVYVYPECAGRGIGKEIMLALEDLARNEGIIEGHLLSTVSAVDFYSRLKYGTIETIDFDKYFKRYNSNIPFTLMTKKL